MRIRFFCLVAVVSASALFPTAVEAQTLYQKLSDFTHDFSRSVVRDFKRNNCFPEPFQRPDRVSIRAPFNVIVQNGWERQNMLGDHHFDESGQTLNEVGELKVRWILLEAPLHHRTVYVHRAASPEKTSQRIDAVRQFALGILPTGEVPEIQETSIGMAGWPAERVGDLQRKYQESTPEPRLPAATDGG
jgi:hypothetical protein